MTPEQLARDAARLVDRLEAAQVRRITALIRSVEIDAKALLSGLALRDATRSRAFTELRVRQALESSRAATALLDMGRSSGPLAREFRAGITAAHADGVRSATAAAAAAGITEASTVLAFGSRVDLELIEAITRTTLTTLERVTARGLVNLEDAIVRGAVRGAGPRATGRLVRDSLDLTRYEAERITRTVFMRANNEARTSTFRNLDVEYVQHNAANDERTCSYCEARHGVVYRIRDAPSPTLHPQCRCVHTPWRESTPERERGDAYYQASRRDMAERREAEGRKATTATAAAPFERLDGIRPPAPVWAPGRGWL